MYTYYDPYTTLYHFGIKGQKWGIRRYQNKDGTLTSAGRRRYKRGEVMDASNEYDSPVTRKVKADYNNLSDSEFLSKYKVKKDVYRKRVNKYGDPYMHSIKKMVKSQSMSVQARREMIRAQEKNLIPPEQELKYYIQDRNRAIRELNEIKLNIIAQTDSYSRGRDETAKLLHEFHDKYTVVYNVMTGKYILRDKEK